jgi:hypothetical protein
MTKKMYRTKVVNLENDFVGFFLSLELKERKKQNKSSYSRCVDIYNGL